MLMPRIIPCLLIRNGGLVKTFQFESYKYVGDPINAVKIFNEKKADELIILDIDATAQKRQPNFKIIEKLAEECRMPLCYGGGINSLEMAINILGLGVEKVAICSAAAMNPRIIKEISESIGSQSVSVVLDVKRHKFGKKYFMMLNNGKTRANQDIFDFIRTIEDFGAGEIIINSVDNDGVMRGYDFNVVDLVRNKVDLPITILGGAGSLDDMEKAINRYGVIGAAAGSLFVFKGKFKAVLINYPSTHDKIKLLSNSFNTT